MAPKTKGKAQKDASKQKHSQVKPVIMTEANEEKSRTHKKMITNQKNIKTKVVQKNESEQQQFNQNKGSNRSRKSWSQLDLQNINDSNAQENTYKQNQRKIRTSRIEQQAISIRKKIPPFAQLILDTILKIAEYPKKQELEKASLVDQICSMIESTSAKYKKEYFEQVESKIEKLLGLFTKGVERGYAFDQIRIKNAANISLQYQNSENFITFHPTHTVTGQIMRQLILGQIEKYQISFGHHGIAKTFAYYLYHQLSNMFISQVINYEESVVDNYLKQKSAKLQFRGSLDQKLLLNIPKLIYWNMKIQSEIDGDYLIKLFLKQCPQINHEINLVNEDNKKISFKKFVEQICQLYRNKGIIVYLVIDQMNKIASCFRDFFIIDEKAKCYPILKESQQYKDKKNIYQSAKTLNDFRYSLLTINNGFHRVFYNSSANLEAISKIDESSQQQVYKKIKQQLKLEDISSHDEPVYETSRVFYPQIINLESTIWSLTDTIIFEVKKFNWFQVKDQKEMQKLREKIFIHLRDRSSNTVLTFLRIRLAVKDAITKIQRQKITIKNVDQTMKAILQIAQEKQKQQLDEKLKLFIGKVTKKEQRLQAIAQVYNFMHEKLQTQEKLSTIKTTETKMKELAFLENPICLEKTQTLLLNNLDRHLFLFFKKNDQFRKFFYSFKKLLKQNLSSWLGKKYNGEKVDKQLQQLQKHIQNKNRNSYELGFSFLSPENVISLLRPKMRQLSQLRKEDWSI